ITGALWGVRELAPAVCRPVEPGRAATIHTREHHHPRNPSPSFRAEYPAPLLLREAPGQVVEESLLELPERKSQVSLTPNLKPLTSKSHHPRVCNKSFSSICRTSRPFIASPSSSEASNTTFGSL